MMIQGAGVMTISGEDDCVISVENVFGVGCVGNTGNFRGAFSLFMQDLKQGYQNCKGYSFWLVYSYSLFPGLR